MPPLVGEMLVVSLDRIALGVPGPDLPEAVIAPVSSLWTAHYSVWATRHTVVPEDALSADDVPADQVTEVGLVGIEDARVLLDTALALDIGICNVSHVPGVTAIAPQGGIVGWVLQLQTGT